MWTLQIKITTTEQNTTALQEPKQNQLKILHTHTHIQNKANCNTFCAQEKPQGQDSAPMPPHLWPSLPAPEKKKSDFNRKDRCFFPSATNGASLFRWARSIQSIIAAAEYIP